MNIDQITQAVVEAYPVRQPLMIWGPPGVGKSSGVEAAAEILNEMHQPAKGGTPRKNPLPVFQLIDLRLSQLEPVDLRGIPFPDQKEGVARWYRPAFLPTSGMGILFLDELVDSTPSMQAAASQLILNRRLGDYVLPDGWMVMGAGNQLEHRASAGRMPTQIANRFVHLYAESDVDSWIKWALRVKLDLRVIAFVKFQRTRLHQFDPKDKGHAFPSPRSWEFASKLLGRNMQSRSLLEAMIKGSVGEGAGGEFCAFLRVADKLVSIDSILLNPKTTEIPTDLGALHAVCTSLAHRATRDNISSIVTYLTRISEAGRPEFSVAAMKEIEAKDKTLAQTKAFIEWAAAHNHLLS